MNRLFWIAVIFLAACTKEADVKMWTKETITVSPMASMKGIIVEEWLSAEEIVELTVNLDIDGMMVPVLNKTERTFDIPSELVIRDNTFVGSLVQASAVFLLDADGKQVGHIPKKVLEAAQDQIILNINDFDMLEIVLDDVFRFYPMNITIRPPIVVPMN